MIIYRLDSEDLAAVYGIYISDSKGVIDALKMKTILKEDWPDENGILIDLSNPKYAQREITLNCFMKANSKDEFLNKILAFTEHILSPGLHRLHIEVNEQKPLVYDVYFPDGLDMKKRWRDGLMVGTFNLDMVEPESNKMVCKFTKTGTTACFFKFSSNRYFNISWGDGSRVANRTLDCTGNTVYNHSYAANKTYFIIISGNMEEAPLTESNADIVWNRL